MIVPPAPLSPVRHPERARSCRRAAGAGLQPATLADVRTIPVRLRISALLTSCIVLPVCAGHAQSTGAVRGAAPARHVPILIGYVRPDSANAHERAFDLGVRFGLEEAMHAAKLLGRSLIAVELDQSGFGEPAADATTLRTGTAGYPEAPAPSILLMARLSDSLAG